MKPSPVVLSVVALIAALVCADADPQPQKNDVDHQEKAPLVVGMTGVWVSQGDAKEWLAINSGKTTKPPLPQVVFLRTINLKDGACVEGTGGSLTLKFNDNENPLSFACEKPDDCDCRLATFPSEDQTKNWQAQSQAKQFMCVRQVTPTKAVSLRDALSDAVLLLTRFPERFIAPVSRGPEPELADSVASLQASKLDMSAAFRDMPTGPYRIRIESLATGAPPRTLFTTRVPWQEGGRASLSVEESFRPGLYRAVHLSAQGQPAGTGAWILAADDKHFPQTSADFGKAQGSVSNWPDTVDARAPRAILRAYLEALSRRQQ